LQAVADLLVSGSYCTVSSSSRQSGLEAAFKDSHSTSQSCSLLQYQLGVSFRSNLASRTEPARPVETVPHLYRNKSGTSGAIRHSCLCQGLPGRRTTGLCEAAAVAFRTTRTQQLSVNRAFMHVRKTRPRSGCARLQTLNKSFCAVNTRDSRTSQNVSAVLRSSATQTAS